MSITIRPFVGKIVHVPGCKRVRCGDGCKREQRGWEVDIRLTLPNGEPYRERKKSMCSSKSSTETWAKQREAHLIKFGIAEGTTPVVKEVPTVAGFYEAFMAYSKTNNRPSTVCAKEAMMRCHLLPFFGAMKLDTVGPEDVDRYKARKLAEELEKKTINNHLAALRKLFNLAAEYGKIDRVPKIKAFALTKNKSITSDEFLTFEEADRFVGAAAPEWKVFLLVALRTGLRVGELLALRWGDIDFVQGVLVVRRTAWRKQEGPPKSGSERVVPLSGEVRSALRQYRHLKGEYVFCDDHGNRLTHSAVKNVAPTTCKRAGLAKRITTHKLRHTFASHLAMRGKPEKCVQDLLGHGSAAMTQRYTHLSPNVLRDAVESLDMPAPVTATNSTSALTAAAPMET